MSFFWFVLLIYVGYSQNDTTTAPLTTTTPMVTETFYNTTAVSTEAPKLCPALKSHVKFFVKIFDKQRNKTNIYNYTTLTTNVKWSPFRYELKQSPVTVFPIRSNPCNIGSIPDIGGNVVLIMDRDEYNMCEKQQWVLNLESEGALAVLIWDQDPFNYISEPLGNSNLTDPSIPSRVISYDDGRRIYRLWIGARSAIIDLDVKVKFTCFNDSFPTHLCINDNGNGEVWQIDGDYQKNEVIINDHPVWFKLNYGGTYGVSKYIFLITDVDKGWRWVIGSTYVEVQSFEDLHNTGISDNYYGADAYCEISSNHTAIHPGLCNNWYVYSNDMNGNGEWRSVDYIQSNEGLCNKLDYKLFCLKSNANDKYPYDKVVGTYYQVHESASTWYKIDGFNIDNGTDISDTVMRFDCVSRVNGFCRFVGWVLFDPSTFRPKARCVWGSINAWVSSPLRDVIRLKAHECNWWWLVVNEDGVDRYVFDEYIDFDEGQCGDTTQQEDIIYPEKLCFKTVRQYEMVQRFFGIWNKINITYDNRPVYQFEDGPYVLIFSDHQDTWQITEGIPSTVPYEILASCYLANNPATPLECTDGVAFNDNQWFSRTSLFLNWTDTTEECFPMTNNIPLNIPDTICIEISSDNVTLDRHNQSDMHGNYINQGKFNDKYYFAKQGIESTYYIYYNNLWRFWMIDSKLNQNYDNFTFPFFCPMYTISNPVQCKDWWTSDIRVYSSEIEYFCSFNEPDTFCRQYIASHHFGIHAGTCDNKTATQPPSISVSLSPTMQPTLWTTTLIGPETTSIFNNAETQEPNKKNFLVVISIILGVVVVCLCGIVLYKRKNDNKYGRFDNGDYEFDSQQIDMTPHPSSNTKKDFNYDTSKGHKVVDSSGDDDDATDEDELKNDNKSDNSENDKLR